MSTPAGCRATSTTRPLPGCCCSPDGVDEAGLGWTGRCLGSWQAPDLYGSARPPAWPTSRSRLLEHRRVRPLSGALRPYRGRLVVWGGANSTAGPVSHYLGALAATQGQLDQAVADFEDAESLEREIGALPFLAQTLVALADVLTARRSDGDPARADVCRHEAHRIAEQLDLLGVLASVGAPPDTWALLREGADWLLTAGGEGCRLRASRGLHYLRTLLATPGVEIPALDLVAGGAGLAGAYADPILDDTARESFRRRVDELDAELDQADLAGDEDRARRAASERLAILDELRRATGLGGPARRMAADEERARVNVTRTLRAAVERIGASAPRVGAHLEASLRTGRMCRYQPAPGGPSGWRL